MEIDFFKKWAKRYEDKKQEAMQRLSRFPDGQDQIGWMYDAILNFHKIIIESKIDLLQAENEVRRLEKGKEKPRKRQKRRKAK